MVAYYNVPQTYSHTYTNSHDYSNVRSWGNHHHNNKWNNWNKWHGNGWTASNWAKKWYPGWKTYSYKWKNNCWWVYMNKGHHWRTVCVGPKYNWHTYKSGYWW